MTADATGPTDPVDPVAAAGPAGSADRPDAGDTDALDRSQRWQVLLDAVARSGRLSVAAAARRLGVSEATVRRDFTALAEQQLVTRTHGGVVAAAVAYDLPVQYRVLSPTDARERIAGAACALLEPGTVVGLNGGTTTSAVARRLAARPDLTGSAGRPAITVVTNALNIASEMVLRPHIRTVTLGGVARPQSYELVGPLAAMVLDQLWIDVLVLGADGFDLVSGPSTHHDSEAGVNAHLVRRSDRVVLVVGSEKLGVRTFARICDTDQVDVLVTDDAADPAVVAGVRDAGIEVVLA